MLPVITFIFQGLIDSTLTTKILLSEALRKQATECVVSSLKQHKEHRY